MSQPRSLNTTALAGWGGLRRGTLLALGGVFFAIGAVGIFVPLLPTTVFWIVAALCFMRSHPGLYRRIVENPALGETIRGFIEDGVIDRRGKTYAICGIAGAFAISLFWADSTLAAATGACLILVAAFIATRPEARAPSPGPGGPNAASD